MNLNGYTARICTAIKHVRPELWLFDYCAGLIEIRYWMYQTALMVQVLLDGNVSPLVFSMHNNEINNIGTEITFALMSAT